MALGLSVPGKQLLGRTDDGPDADDDQHDSDHLFHGIEFAPVMEKMKQQAGDALRRHRQSKPQRFDGFLRVMQWCGA